MKHLTKADDKGSPFGYETYGPKATMCYSGIAVILKYCKGISSAVEYPLELKLIELHIEDGNSSAAEYSLGLKLIGLYIEDVSFATDQPERRLEIRSTGYESYDSSAKRRILMSFVLFFRIYYKGGMLGEQSASLSGAYVLTEGQPAG
ncbi:Uncharacterized protein Adt_20052 [Abeliophyllum distichum]|uniref:Uncharacterized protein n=1 Tax=Abeliophyllum distichum TaxID=126358 RepID=A0ABD1SUP9_9LAMI